jgi:hypothetical protein
MKGTEVPAFDSYLDAKRETDERSLHEPTWRAYLAFLAGRARPGPAGAAPDRPAVLELGTGLGSMLDRTLRGLAPGAGFVGGDGFGAGLAYVAVDTSQDLLEVLRRRFAAPPYGRPALEPETRCGDALDELAKLAAEGRRFDAVVSHAFVDLVDIPRLASAVSKVLVPRGIFYSSLVFDGITAFIPSPADTAEADDRYIGAYHRSMRRPWNGSFQPGNGLPFAHEDGASGRRLLALLAERPWMVQSAGPSDWLILPVRSSVSEDERTVVAKMLGFFSESVGEALSGEERDAFESWLETKRARLAAGELGFYAHHLDVLAVLGD